MSANVASSTTQHNTAGRNIWPSGGVDDRGLQAIEVPLHFRKRDWLTKVRYSMPDMKMRIIPNKY